MNKGRGMEPGKTSPRWVRIRRALILSFTLGLLATLGLVLLTAAQFGGTTEPGTYHLRLGTLNFFTVVNQQLAEGSRAELRPGFGILVLTVVLPLFSGALAWRTRPSR